MSVMRLTILRAWPGCTRSSRVDVMKKTFGYVFDLSRFWYGDHFCM